MDIELGICASFGSISRIESGKVNPTKETIEKIATILSLTDRELDYLVGPTSVPATIEECDLAENETNEYFQDKYAVAYLTDDRLRMIRMSSALYKILNLTPEQVEQIRYKTLVEFLLVEKYGIKKFFVINYERNLSLIIQRFVAETGHMIDDESYLAQRELILSDPIASRIWFEVINNGHNNIFKYDEHFITFNYFGTELKLRYINEPLAKYKRFHIIEYIPTDELKMLLAKSNA